MGDKDSHQDISSLKFNFYGQVKQKNIFCFQKKKKEREKAAYSKFSLVNSHQKTQLTKKRRFHQ